MHAVLLVPDVRGKSGWSRYALDIGKALHERGWKISLVVAKKANVPWADEYEILSPDAHNPYRAVSSAFKMRQLLQQLQPDIVHVIAEPYALMLPLLPNGKWKTVITFHGTYAARMLGAKGWEGYLALRALQQADGIISVSNFTKNYVHSCNPVRFTKAHLEQKIEVIHNAVDLAGKQPHQKEPACISASR